MFLLTVFLTSQTKRVKHKPIQAKPSQIGNSGNLYKPSLVLQLGLKSLPRIAIYRVVENGRKSGGGGLEGQVKWTFY
jgi:hypothetical protein